MSSVSSVVQIYCVLLFILLLDISVATSEKADHLLVQTLQGPIRGYKDPLENIYAFYGIPYATVPTERNRYKPPLPAPVWTTPLEAVDDKIICPQNKRPDRQQFYTGKIIKEQCLIANVYKPNTNQTNIPVLVNVHGGGFQAGFGNIYLPKKLTATQTIIVVTFNYRLSVHGFLCLGTKDIPGNAGMKDQLALLHWVKDNIASFGGNPNDVTIDGCSAGAASVSLLMLSPAAKGLFTKVSAASGGIFVGSAVQLDPIENAKEFAKRFISNVNNITVLEEFYKDASFEIITSDSFLDRKDSSFPFAPCIERETTEKPFLTQSPYNIVKSGNYEKIPLLYGVTIAEGSSQISFFDIWKNDMNSQFSDFLPTDLQFDSADEKTRVAKEVKQFYFGNHNISNENILSYVNFFSDFIFIYPIMKALKLYVNSGHDHIFLYEYSFVDEDTPVIPYTNIREPVHCAQFYALFDLISFINTKEISEEYKKMRSVIRYLWANFIRTGNPTLKSMSILWPPTKANETILMSIGKTIQLRGAISEERMALWERIYDRHYRLPAPPCYPSLQTN